MKRSEMVQRMTEYWLGLLPGEPPENMNVEEVFDEVHGMMDNLLSFLEHKKGMMPPEIVNFCSCSDCNPYGDRSFGWEEE